MVVSTSMMSVTDRKRALVHSTALITQKILAQPNANPVGLVITVTELPTQPDVHPDLLIVATCPQFESFEFSLK